MTGPGAEQDEAPEQDEAHPRGAADDHVANRDSAQAAGPDSIARPRSGRAVGAATGWTQSLTSTRALPGPAGLTLADVPNRILALVLDILLLSALGLLLALLLGGLFGGMTRGGATVGGSLDDPGRELNVAAFLVVVLAQLAFSLAYFAYGWVMLRGTLGMRLLGLRIGDRSDGQPVAWDQALVRWVLLGLPVTVLTFVVYVPSLIGLLLSLLAGLWLVLLLASMAQGPAKQGLHDRYARTIVVRAPRRHG